MTERLDRIEQGLADLNSAMNMMLTEFIRPLVQQSQVNQQALAGLIEMTATAEVERGEQNQRIEILLNDAIADRQRSDQRFEQMTTQADADRTENARRFDEITAQADASRAEWRANFNAQQEVIQTLLLEIRSSNGEISQLSNRVNNLEQAS
jgi:cell division septum initiation protein DivIVA